LRADCPSRNSQHGDCEENSFNEFFHRSEIIGYKGHEQKSILKGTPRPDEKGERDARPSQKTG
jgi:hypothetical protein